ncbi:MAG: MFS transporter, partial [Actinomycetota bacterium]|nr:MFS transporter [Actinomycetota bacterium]
DSALMAGALGVPGGLAAGLGIQVATRLLDRSPARRIVTTGLLLSALAFAGLVAVLRTDTSYAVLAALGALLGFGSGAVILPTMTAATRHFDGADLASAASIMGLLQQLASAFGIAGITALFAGLAPLDAPATDLVSAQRLAQLVPLALVVIALAVALARLGRYPTKEVTDELDPDRAALAERG